MSIRLICCGSGSHGNTFILKAENCALILDAGIKPSLIKRALDYDISSIEGVVITHKHL